MKMLFLIFIFCLFVLPISAYSTEASRFAEKQYSTQNKCKVHINSKKEHTLKYQDFIGKQSVSEIKYGWGDMKVKGCKKCRISYIVILDNNYKPAWSSVYTTK